MKHIYSLIHPSVETLGYCALIPIGIREYRILPALIATGCMVDSL